MEAAAGDHAFRGNSAAEDEDSSAIGGAKMPAAEDMEISSTLQETKVLSAEDVAVSLELQEVTVPPAQDTAVSSTFREARLPPADAVAAPQASQEENVSCAVGVAASPTFSDASVITVSSATGEAATLPAAEGAEVPSNVELAAEEAAAAPAAVQVAGAPPAADVARAPPAVGIPAVRDGVAMEAEIDKVIDMHSFSVCAMVHCYKVNALVTETSKLVPTLEKVVKNLRDREVPNKGNEADSQQSRDVSPQQQQEANMPRLPEEQPEIFDIFQKIKEHVDNLMTKYTHMQLLQDSWLRESRKLTERLAELARDAAAGGDALSAKRVFTSTRSCLSCYIQELDGLMLAIKHVVFRLLHI